MSSYDFQKDVNERNEQDFQKDVKPYRDSEGTITPLFRVLLLLFL